MSKLFLLLTIFVLFIAGDAPLFSVATICETATPHLLVKAGLHRLILCEQSRVVKDYNVRLARRGLGKQKAKDKKLPLGTYPLGDPRPSEKFGIFIPVGYPTPVQQSMGYTGSGIGVHGPIRWARFLGPLVNWIDTTSGCIGLATDKEMDEISNWVRRTHAKTIQLER